MRIVLTTFVWVLLSGISRGEVGDPANRGSVHDRSLQSTPAVENLPSGDRVILEKLWTPEELQGNPGERKTQHLARPDSFPPKESEQKERLPSLPPRPPSSIRRVELASPYKVVALTFDLCERAKDIAGYDASIVDYLRAEKVRATFFAGGKWMHDHPERTMQLMADSLFEIGNHTWSHANLRLVSGQQLDEQILWTQTQYELLREELARRARQQGIDEKEIAPIPAVPLTFRFPYGTCSPEALAAVANAGLSAIQWDVVSGDPDQHQTAARIVETVVQQTKPGSIVIFHANGRGYETAEALPRIVSTLRERGFNFVTVSELLNLASQTGGTVRAVSDCYEHRPGDNRRYDKFVRKETSK